MELISLSNKAACQASIIVRCYNEEAHIGRLLSGIMQQATDDFEIIVVDSGSTDATLEIIPIILFDSMQKSVVNEPESDTDA